MKNYDSLNQSKKAHPKEALKVSEEVNNNKEYIKVSVAYALDSEWSDINEFVGEIEKMQSTLKAKWGGELNYNLKKQIWGFNDNRISARFEYEFKDKKSNWIRSTTDRYNDTHKKGVKNICTAPFTPRTSNIT